LSAADGQHISGYDPAIASMIMNEAADILRAMSFTAQHAVLIGGLVPGLLVPVLDPGLEPHIGTTDLDLCLSMALVDGDTAEYERIETVIMTLEFFCPASPPEREAGRLFRPNATERPRAKHNLGGRLSALALAAGELLTTDIERITRVVELPDNRGGLEVVLKVTGPVAFLVAKSHALHLRDKAKDAYDIVWLLENWPGGPGAAAAAFSQRPVIGRDDVQEELRNLRKAFVSSSVIGTRSYARFVSRSRTEEPNLERRAIAVVDEFFNGLAALVDRPST
jgi:Nucleotidyl transferase AbiEii toxin, Type IV TA system